MSKKREKPSEPSTFDRIEAAVERLFGPATPTLVEEAVDKISKKANKDRVEEADTDNGEE